MLMLAAITAPLQAIEPPVEAQPIPPRNIPTEKKAAPPKALRVMPEFEAPEALPLVAEASTRPYIGVILDPVPDLLSSHLKLAAGEGLVVGELVAGGPAEKAGLAVNDIITHVDGVPVGSPEQVRESVEKHEIGDVVKLDVIHDGEKSAVSVTLGEAPDLPQAGMALNGADNLNGFLENLPEKHADVMRKAMEQRLQALGQLDDGGNMPDNWQRDLFRRMELRMGAGGEGLDLGDFQAESSVRLLDDQGSIEMKGVDGSKEVRVFDKGGKLVWEGPYDTDQDKAAVPDDIRERIEKVDLKMDFNGNGIQLKLAQQRFRPLDDIEPKKAERLQFDED